MKNKRKSKSTGIQPGYLLDMFFVGIKNVFFPQSNNKKNLKICNCCGIKKAVWFNSLMVEYACDECVPRCCSCQIYPKNGNENDYNADNWDYKKDENGEYIPCEDWERIKKKN